MPIDTTSYYPELPNNEGEEKGESLNRPWKSLFGEEPLVEEIIVEEKKESCPLGNPEFNEKRNFWEQFTDICSNVLSWLLVPLLMPVFGIIFIFRLSVLDVVSPGLQIAVIFVIFGISFVAPMLLFFLLKVMGLVTDVGLNKQKERLIPYLIAALCYGGCAWFVASRSAPVWVAMFFCGGAVASLINLCINLKWKISAHTAAIAGVIALLIRLQRDTAAEPQLFVWLLITVGAAGLLGSARVWLRRHTVWQVLAGYVVGFCSVFFMMYVH